MNISDHQEVTELLRLIEKGDMDAYNRLVQLVRSNFKRIAAKRLKRERPGHLYLTSDLVQEACLRIFKIRHLEWEGRSHFFKIAAMEMRRILVEYARRNRPEGHERIAIDDIPGLMIIDDESILFINELLDELAAINNRIAHVFELKYFGGYKIDEISLITGIPVGTVKRHWSTAKAFFKLKFGPLSDPGANLSGSLSSTR